MSPFGTQRTFSTTLTDVPLLEAKRTLVGGVAMSALDPSGHGSLVIAAVQTDR